MHVSMLFIVTHTTAVLIVFGLTIARK